MLQLRRILVATDFSPHSHQAWLYGVSLAEAFKAELILLHVIEPPDVLSQFPPSGEAYFPPNLAQIQEEFAQKTGGEWIAEVGSLPARLLTRTGSPFVEIIAASKEEQIDLIVLGTHGRGAIAHLLLGSVAERVVRKAPCPVLTVRVGQQPFSMP